MKNSDSFFLWLAEYTVHRQMYISSKLWIIWKFTGINLKTKTHNFPQNTDILLLYYFQWVLQF